MPTVKMPGSGCGKQMQVSISRKPLAGVTLVPALARRGEISRPATTPGGLRRPALPGIKPNQGKSAPQEISTNCNHPSAPQPAAPALSSTSGSSQIKVNQAPQEISANCNHPSAPQSAAPALPSTSGSSQIKANQAPHEISTSCNHPMQGAQLAICNLQPPATSQCSQMKANPTNGNQFTDKPPR
jgi:hypothetical protein